MRQYEPFKRLFRLIGALLLMGAEVGAYGYVWNGYFNKMIEFPFWRRGNWLMIALYAGILFFEFSVTSEEGKGTKVRMSKKIGAKDAADA